MNKKISIIIEQSRCDFCGTCVAVCTEDAIQLSEAQIIVNDQLCILCFNCVDVCPLGVLEVS